jgi:hypothetical protein
MENILVSKINLVAEQINEIERSGFYTDKEIESKVPALYAELELLQNHLVAAIQTDPKGLLGLEKVEITLCQYFFMAIRKKTTAIDNIEVINPVFVSPQTLSA